ncbi:MAG: alpha/beta hydrolase [Bacteroidales bacterium]|nr:alpha/beta hydrolase [Bacteroidales bacterium]
MNHFIKYGLICIAIFSFKTAYTQNNTKTVTFITTDNVLVTADVYLTERKDAPFILLFHQAIFSRGEYIEIAPQLNDLGFNCMAIDQRSGYKINGITNETFKDAKSKGMGTKYINAFPDLEASLQYVEDNYSPEKIIVWGSSYSSSLVFILAAKHKEINGILAFSPGEYFKFENKTIADWAKEVECPVFITSSRKEGKECKKIFKNLTNQNSKQYIPAFSGNHGSKALWKKNNGNESYLREVKLFLSIFN